MQSSMKAWDYLILTASDDAQAAVYRAQMDLRRGFGLVAPVRQVLVVADPEGRRVGSGGSTLQCLMEVLDQELAGCGSNPGRSEAWIETLGRLRIFILHAGGDSRRLPAYGPCGKVFVPVPGPSDSALGPTLFDRQWPIYAELPPAVGGSGQVVIASGDVFLGFSPEEVSFAPSGFTGLGCAVAPEQACQHGVYCAGAGGSVRRFLQKPSLAVQAAEGAINRVGQAILDIGLVHFDAATAVRLLEICEAHPDSSGRLHWSGRVGEAVLDQGLDFYREICCALGPASTWDAYRSAVRAAGSTLDDWLLERVFAQVAPIPCRVQILGRCDFLHFGTTAQLLTSGQQLVSRENGLFAAKPYLGVNNQILHGAVVNAKGAWLEGCRIATGLTLPEQNVLVGVDVEEPLHLPPRACLDLLPGRSRTEEPVVFVRCYHMTDRFDAPGPSESCLSGFPLVRFLASAEVQAEDVWNESIPPEKRNAWNARLFPTEREPAGFRRWLWMLEPARASADQFRAWREADRYSLAEMAVLADRQAFFSRRARLHGDSVVGSLRSYFHGRSGFSAADIACLLAEPGTRTARMAKFLEEACSAAEHAVATNPDEVFLPSRILHSLGTAVETTAASLDQTLGGLFPGIAETLRRDQVEWLSGKGLELLEDRPARDWARQAQTQAFEHLQRTIIGSGEVPESPRNALRSDEIVWGRSPVRLDLAGGWTDTPPFALEHGGCVANAAVILNGEPPIQVYARVTPEPFIRIHSIDLGTDCDIRQWDELLDYRSATGEFSLVKAALVLAGFAPAACSSPNGSLEELLEQFGGGLELTTLAAVPKGSGLGTSSIMGAVVLAVIHRVLGREFSSTELFHAVLRLEQALTTGGGWQDQIGGVLGSVKLITTRPGLVPEPTVRCVPPDVLDPKANGGQTLLYYTGITRLAKNILAQVVGRYLDRNRSTMATLRRIQALAPEVAEAMARKDLAAFGEAIDTAWVLNKEIDPDSSNPQIEAILGKVRPHIYGAKLLGAGGGGFLLMICRSAEDARAVKRRLESQPPNSRARFFDFQVSLDGLSVSVC